ncbi:putative 30.3 kDa protein [Aphomia sociella]
MKTTLEIGVELLFLFLAVNANTLHSVDLQNGDNRSSNETSYSLYSTGVDTGVINPEKYSFTSFKRDEENVFRDLYREYTTINSSLPVSYEEWLLINNFGVLSDTQESLFERKISKRSTADNKRRFVNTVKKGDILVTGRGIGGLVGHAAIMTTDNWVLEMPGGRGWQNGIKDNNRQITKHKWFDEHASDWTTVYRCPDGNAARSAAVWADHTYYNPSGGATKTKHITYKITTDVWSTNPSYCSKLVIQAYYFGTGKKKVISGDVSLRRVIIPSTIPSYFLSPYKLKNMGKY